MSSIANNNGNLMNEDTLKMTRDMLISYNHVCKWNIQKEKGKQEKGHGACGFKNCEELTNLYNHRKETKHALDCFQLIDCTYPNCKTIHSMLFHFKTCYQSECEICTIPRKALDQGAYFFCTQNGLVLEEEGEEKQTNEVEEFEKIREKMEREEDEKRFLAEVEEKEKIERELGQWKELNESLRNVITTLIPKVKAQEQEIMELKENQELLQKENEQQKKERDYGVKQYECTVIQELRDENKRQAEKIEALKKELEVVSMANKKEEIKQEEISNPDFNQFNFNVMEHRTGPTKNSEVQEEKKDEEKTIPNFEWGFFGMITDEMKQLRAENAELKQQLNAEKEEETKKNESNELEKKNDEQEEESEEDSDDADDSDEDSDDSDDDSDEDSDDDDSSENDKEETTETKNTEATTEDKPEDQLVICHVIDILIGFVLLFGLYSLICFFIERIVS